MADAVAAGCNETLPAATHNAAETRLLFVLPIVPWPFRRNGISLRFGPVVDYLMQRHQLDILVLAEEDEPVPADPAGRRHGLAFIEVPPTPLPRWLRRIRTAWYGLSPWTPPLSSSRYASGQLERALLSYLQHNHYSVVVWAARHLDVACRVRRRYPDIRFVIDLTDSPALFSFRNASSNLLLRMLTRYDGWRWRRLERRVLKAFDATIYITNIDAHAVAAGRSSRVHVVPNGIFHADAPPLSRSAPAGRIIGFLGNMAYPPNVSAALRLAQRIFPRILTMVADASLLIIGRDPAPAISELAGPRINVTGTVDNIWPYITRANVFVFPMIEGTGLQNKILEAMYAGVPVVTTPIAADALGASSGQQLLVADSDDEIAAQAVQVLCDSRYSAGLAERAQAFVQREFSWPAILPRYEAIVVPR